MKTIRLDADSMLEQCDAVAHLLKLLAHPQRLQVLCHLSMGEKTVSDLGELCDASQSQLSQFLQRMRAEGLVSSRRDGKFVRYAIQDPRVLKLMRSLHDVFCSKETASISKRSKQS